MCWYWADIFRSSYKSLVEVLSFWQLTVMTLFICDMCFEEVLVVLLHAALSWIKLWLRQLYHNVDDLKDIGVMFV